MSVPYSAANPQAGYALFREIIGDPAVLQPLREVVPDIDRYAIDLFYGDVYGRPGLDTRTRELLTVVALATLGTAEQQLRTHLNAALRLGCSRKELTEALLQIMLIAGLPAALNALRIAGEVFADTAEEPAAGA